MGYEFARATTAAEIEAVQRLRYTVYVEEMKRYDDVEGGEDGRFAEPEDEHSWICYARDGNHVVAATRMTWGGDGFSNRQVDQFQLAPFLAEIPADLMGSASATRCSRHIAALVCSTSYWLTPARRPTCRTCGWRSAVVNRICCRCT